MAQFIIPLMIETSSNGVRAEAKITLGEHVLGYIGGSRFEDTVRDDAVEALAQALGPLVRDQLLVTPTSGFDYQG